MIHNEIKYAKLEDLYLDPLNPRLGRENTGHKVKQSAVIKLMESWKLDELAISFLENNYWPHEALLVVVEKLYDKQRLVVIEGNRRLAALKLLERSIEGSPVSSKWKEIAESGKPDENLFKRIPYILADSRADADAFLGFRHVTGIEEWNPAEKAEFIAKLLNQGLSYDEVRRKIGSKTPTVRRHYIAFRLLRQMEEQGDKIALEEVESRFSVLYLSLRTDGVQKYLHINIKADPKAAHRPVPAKYKKQLVNFARWLFGDEKSPALFTDSRNVDKFGAILESNEAVDYLERNPNPSFERARQIAGGDELELSNLLLAASDNIQQVLAIVHRFKESKRVIAAVSKLRVDAQELFDKFSTEKSASS